jgi:hypothetical protein
MSVHLIYLLSVALVMGAGILGYRTYLLQRHIRQELRALRAANDAKVRQAKIAESIAAASPVCGVVSNPESGVNAYGLAPENRPIGIHNSYSL